MKFMNYSVLYFGLQTKFLSFKIDYHGESTEGDLMLYPTTTSEGDINILGLQSVDSIVDVNYSKLESAVHVGNQDYSQALQSSCQKLGFKSIKWGQLCMSY